MLHFKRILCLANSRKLNGRCIAGKEVISGRPGCWIRPVSDRDHEEVSEYERQYEDGSDPRVLDVMDVPLLEPKPRDYQTENWLLDPEYYWERVEQVKCEQLKGFVERPKLLWINGYSTYNGKNDKIPFALATGLTSSLYLILVKNVRLSVFKPGEVFGNSKRRVQGQFEYNGTVYKLWVTDPDYEKAYLAREDGHYELDQCYLTISLGEAHNDAAYKLIAAIIQPF